MPEQTYISHPVTIHPEQLRAVAWFNAEQAQQQYGASAIQSVRHLSGAFKVVEQQQVADVLSWAKQNSAAIQPISSGRN